MARTADAIIIGGGIAGASTAYFLAAKGVKDVVLIERDSIASGATGRSGAEVFLHGQSPERTRVVWNSLLTYRDWPDKVGGDAGFRRTGTLAIVGPEHTADAQAVVKNARSLGIHMDLISPDEVRGLQPFLRTDDIGGALYSRDAGHGDGYSAANAMAFAARRMGVQMVLHTAVGSINEQGGRVTGVTTAAGDVLSAPVVVLAAGAWSAPLARTAGADLPITPYRVCAGLLVRPPEIPEHMAMTDRTIGTYWRMEGPTLTLMGIRNKEIMGPCDPENVPQGIDEATQLKWARRISHRMPAMMEASWRSVWSAPDAYTADHYPLVGPAGEPDGLYFATGYSGSGFMLGPASGQCLAELIVDGRATTADVSAMRPGRFAEGRPNVAAAGYHWPYDPAVDERFP